MKVAILSDTHGALDTRIAELVRACDYAVHAGDVGNSRVLQELRPRTAVVAVRGNNDVTNKWPPIDHARLEQLQDTVLLPLPGGDLAVVHGHRHGSPRDRHRRLRQAFPSARAIVYGHSHRLVCDTALDPWVINPGAGGRARTFGGPSCVLLTIDGNQWELQAQRYSKA